MPPGGAMTECHRLSRIDLSERLGLRIGNITSRARKRPEPHRRGVSRFGLTVDRFPRHWIEPASQLRRINPHSARLRNDRLRAAVAEALGPRRLRRCGLRSKRGSAAVQSLVDQGQNGGVTAEVALLGPSLDPVEASFAEANRGRWIERLNHSAVIHPPASKAKM